MIIAAQDKAEVVETEKPKEDKPKKTTKKKAAEAE